jgi:hypothetical protein
MDVLTRVMPRSRVLASGVHLPLKKLALCLDCDECFELGYASCPACGSGTWSPLGRFLDIAAGTRPSRSSSNSNGATRRIQPKRAAEELAIAKHLLVVARHRRELYEEIKRAFAGHESVQVILDRRVSQRREKKGQAMLDRRRTERRSRSVIDEQLRTIGWSLVLLDLAKRPKS